MENEDQTPEPEQRLTQEQLIRLFDAFDRSVDELDQMVRLLDQFVHLSLQPVKESLDAIKSDLGVKSTKEMLSEMEIPEEGESFNATD